MLLGDTAGYRSLCETIAGRTGEPSDPLASYILARAGALSPESGIAPEKLVSWAESARAAYPDQTWVLHTLGLALLRAGRAEEAASRLREAMATDAAWPGRVLNRAALGLAERLLRHPDESYRLFEEVQGWLQGLRNDPALNTLICPQEMHTADWLEMQVLRKEIADR